MVKGSTQVVAIIGTPIAQVKSPENFNRYFAEHEMNRVMIPVDIVAERLGAFMQSLRGWNNLSGVVVTVPHKQHAAELLDALTPRARHLNAVNVVRREADGTLSGDMLDGVGFIRAARRHGFDAAGRSALVVGCGGVGSAIAWGLCEAGISRLALHDREPQSVQLLHNRLATHFPEVHLETLPATLNDRDLVVNATPAGMNGFDPLPLCEDLIASLNPAALAADVVTAPEITPFLTLARRLGCAVQTGPEMAYAQLFEMGMFIGAMPELQPAGAAS